MKQKQVFFWYSLTFSVIQQMLAVWSSLYIWMFSVHKLLKPSLKGLEHYHASMWNECSCAVVWTFFGIALLGIGVKTDLFQSCGHCWVFQLCWHIECNTFTASSFTIWNSSAEIPSPLLALFIVMLPKAHLTSHSRWVIHKVMVIQVVKTILVQYL